MWGITDWFLSTLNLIESDEEIEEEPSEDIIPWLEVIGRKKIKEPLYNKHVFCKKVISYDDTKEVISKYKLGAECVVYLNPMENRDAQGMMNYLCGGIYALEGSIKVAGSNTFVVLHTKKEPI